MFFSKKIIPIKTQYKTYNSKLLAIFEFLRHDIIIEKVIRIRYFFL